MAKRIELWADSFHEGDWACQHLMQHHLARGLKGKESYKDGFIPVYTFEFPDGSLEITVYGSYGSWSPIPEPIEELLAWGKPDLIAFDPESKKILFAVEETAAVPTGNQALQRCERLYGASRKRIPFWYLLAEYGTHKDQGLRRDSIWPTVMALKLSLHNHAPSVILHYADIDNPEGYDFGNGVRALFKALYLILGNNARDLPALDNIEPVLEEHYSDMLRFLSTQYRNIIQHIPGLEHFANKALVKLLADAAVSEEKDMAARFTTKFANWLVWPSLAGWNASISAPVRSSKTIKHDPLAELVEASIDEEACYVISSNAGSRPQKRAELEEWISKQNRSFKAAARRLKIDATLDMQISDFPTSERGNHHVTTAKNILYLFDEFEKLNDLIAKAYPRLAGKLSNISGNSPAMLYVSNTVKPGRLFGDPFTGQISAYSVVFGKFDQPPRAVVAYFPHQSFSQFLDSPTKLVTNKGYVLMRELVDIVILGGGVAIRFNDDGRAYPI